MNLLVLSIVSLKLEGLGLREGTGDTLPALKLKAPQQGYSE